LGYQSTESSDIQNKNNKTLSDYTNSYLTSKLEYSKLNTTNSNFLEKSSLFITTGFGKRITNDSPETIGTNKQFYIKLDVLNTFYLNPKNSININSRTNFLKSETYIINELFRFGGSNSIRGFTENSLQANFMTTIQTEYRHAVSPSLYIHSITDYGYYQDNSTKNKENLIGLGLGMGLNTKNGLLKLAFANGSFKNQEMKFYNTIIHINYSIKF
jgi:hemolysin activation/secretion protein